MQQQHATTTTMPLTSTGVTGVPDAAINATCVRAHHVTSTFPDLLIVCGGMSGGRGCDSKSNSCTQCMQLILCMCKIIHSLVQMCTEQTTTCHPVQ